MTKDRHYSEQFDYAMRMLEEIRQYPFLAEKLTSTLEFKDFRIQLEIHEELFFHWADGE